MIGSRAWDESHLHILLMLAVRSVGRLNMAMIANGHAAKAILVVRLLRIPYTFLDRKNLFVRGKMRGDGRVSRSGY